LSLKLGWVTGHPSGNYGDTRAVIAFRTGFVTDDDNHATPSFINVCKTITHPDN